MTLAWRAWKDPLSLIYFMFLAFIAVSAVSGPIRVHRAHLDVYLIIFSAFTIDRFFLNNSKKPWSRCTPTEGAEATRLQCTPN